MDNLHKTAFEQACEEALLWEIETMRQRDRERRTDAADGFIKPMEGEMRLDNDKVGMLSDDRPIKSIHGVFGDEMWSWEAGKSCDKIEVYGEPAEYCYVAWFLIYKDGAVINRENSRNVASVCY